MAGRAGACALVAILLAGCSSGSVFYADPALRAGVATERELKAQILHETDGVRLAIHPGETMDTAWLEAELTSSPPQVAILSPFYSLFAAELAGEFPGIEFVGFGAGTAVDNLTRVVVGRDDALRTLVAVLTQHLDLREERVAIFLAENTEARREQSRFLRSLLDEAGIEPHWIHRYAEASARDEIRADARRDLNNDASLFVVLVGPENATVMDLLSAKEVRIITEHRRASGAHEAKVLCSIEFPFATVTRLVSQDLLPSGEVNVEAELVAGGAATEPLLNVMASGAED